MANLQRIFGDDGLPYLIDRPDEDFNAGYSPLTTGIENLELSSEPLSFVRSPDRDISYEQDMAGSREIQMRRPVSMGAIENSGDLSKLTFLSPEKINYQNVDIGDTNFKQASDGIKTQFKQEYGYTPSSGELAQYTKLSGSSSPLRSVLVGPEKTESNTKRISDNFLDNIRNGSLSSDSVPFLSLLKNTQEKGRSNSEAMNTRPTVRVYSSNAFGIPGLNHAYVASPETEQQKGRDGLFGITKGAGGYGFENPYHSVTLPDGMTARDFMDRIQRYPGWNKGLWFPWVNDCHNDLEDAFKYTGVPYPGAPNGRLDIDDDVIGTVKRVADEAQQWS
ncbi:hypothetical protein ACO0LG_17785 [Undibacterium sp. Ji42W]|uniref:hypothetical protein n=1 Tax=Undibacterium sp. Ji42W TaxID=3413039 RepID=UPI003BEFDBCB